jgi:hypothetical protein
MPRRTNTDIDQNLNGDLAKFRPCRARKFRLQQRRKKVRKAPWKATRRLARVAQTPHATRSRRQLVKSPGTRSALMSSTNWSEASGGCRLPCVNTAAPLSPEPVVGCASEPVVEELLKEVWAAEVAHLDETPWRRNGVCCSRLRMRVVVTSNAVVYHIGSRRIPWLRRLRRSALDGGRDVNGYATLSRFGPTSLAKPL